MRARFDRQQSQAVSSLEELEVVPDVPEVDFASEQSQKHLAAREAHHFRELRVFFREALDHCLSERRFAVFATPVAVEVTLNPQSYTLNLQP